MYSWRVTKYNPLKRDNNGYFLNDEWTCFSEVGINVEMDEYLKVEKKYINAVITFMNEMNINKLYIKGLEQWSEDIEAQNATEFISKLWIGQWISIQEVKKLVKLTLRNAVWCKLELGNQFFVHFGYDYYMYIGTSQKCFNALEKVVLTGLHVELVDSPYL
ncbi:hypothetical protein ACWA2C_27820 [Priestia megaterium]